MNKASSLSRLVYADLMLCQTSYVQREGLALILVNTVYTNTLAFLNALREGNQLLLEKSSWEIISYVRVWRKKHPLAGWNCDAVIEIVAYSFAARMKLKPIAMETSLLQDGLTPPPPFAPQLLKKLLRVPGM